MLPRKDCEHHSGVLRTTVARPMPRSRLLRKSVGSQRALNQRRKALALGAALAIGIAGALALLLIGCGGGNSSAIVPPPPIPAVQPLQIADVQKVVQAAINSANVDMVVAVVDRAGFVLGVYQTQNAPTMAVGNFSVTVNANDLAVALA